MARNPCAPLRFGSARISEPAGRDEAGKGAAPRRRSRSCRGRRRPGRGPTGRARPAGRRASDQSTWATSPSTSLSASTWAAKATASVAPSVASTARAGARGDDARQRQPAAELEHLRARRAAGRPSSAPASPTPARPRPRPVRDRTPRAALLVAQLLPVGWADVIGVAHAAHADVQQRGRAAGQVHAAQRGELLGERRRERDAANRSRAADTTLREAMAQELPQPSLRRPLRRHRPGDRQHAARRAQAALAQAGRAPVGEARVAQPDRLGQGPRRARADRGRRGEGRDPPGPDDPRADLGQHRHLAGDDLLAQGLQAQGRHARQRDARADAAAEDVRRGDRLLAGRPGLQRRRRAGAGDGGRGLLVLHALPVRQPGEPERALQRHRAGDPRGARRDRGVRRRPRARAGR